MLTAVLSNVNVQLRCVSQPVLNNHISWFFPLTNSLSCCSVPLLSKSDIEGIECERVLSASLFNNNKNPFPFTPLVTLPTSNGPNNYTEAEVQVHILHVSETLISLLQNYLLIAPIVI